MNNNIIIGIAGGTASGKTTIVKKIKDAFKSNIVVISHDSYYKSHNELTYEERSAINYDHPEAFETTRLIENIKQLKSGENIEIPVYNYSIHNREDYTKTIEPKKIIVVEGILLFENQELRNLMDIKIFVDVDSDERLVRRIKRDVAQRNRDVNSIITQYETTVKPMHEQFVEPYKKYADMIIPRGGNNIIAIEMMISYLSNLFNSDKN